MSEKWIGLKGRTIRNVQVASDGSEIVFGLDDADAVSLQAVADCCAHAYIDDDSRADLPDLRGGLVVAAEVVDGGSVDWNGDVRDTTFYKLRTTKGDLTITLHTEHNGYYSGWLE
jgi:hypothetical protein